MAARRKYKNAIKINSLVDREKMEVLRSIYGNDATVVNKGLDLLLGISYENGKIKSDFLSTIRTDSMRIIDHETKKVNTIDDLLEGRIKAEKKQKKAQIAFVKRVQAIRKNNHLTIHEGELVIDDRLRNTAQELSQELGVPITVKTLIDEIERQEAEA